MPGRLYAFARSACVRLPIIAIIALPLAISAQVPVTPMTPSPPHEALTFFEGSWTIEERPASEGFVETCGWLPAGRRHMVCRSTWTGPSGAREGWSIFSYGAADSTYLYYGLRAGGAVEPMSGRILADGWEFLSEVGAGPTRQGLRVTITRLAPQRFRLVASSSIGDGPWTVVDTEHYVPARPPR
jgi:hypothetical protein